MADFESIERKLERIENALSALKLPKQEKYFYSTDEAAGRLGLSKWYVRRLCSQGEIRAEKHPESGRFLIPAKEMERIETRRDALKR